MNRAWRGGGVPEFHDGAMPTGPLRHVLVRDAIDIPLEPLLDVSAKRSRFVGCLGRRLHLPFLHAVKPSAAMGAYGSYEQDI